MVKPKKYGLSNAEKLKSRKEIGEVFEKKNTVYKYPINCIYTKNSSTPLPKITSVAPKRNFKRAVDRNKIKRLIREAYRLNKSLLTNTSKSSSLNIVFVYVGKELPTFDSVELSIIHILTKLNEKM